jgi:hypothetical protein
MSLGENERNATREKKKESESKEKKELKENFKL